MAVGSASLLLGGRRLLLAGFMLVSFLGGCSQSSSFLQRYPGLMGGEEGAGQQEQEGEEGSYDRMPLDFFNRVLLTSAETVSAP